MIIPNIWNNGSNQPHPDLRSSSFGQGQWPEAEELYRQALQGRRRLLGTSGRWQLGCQFRFKVFKVMEKEHTGTKIDKITW